MKRINRRGFLQQSIAGAALGNMIATGCGKDFAKASFPITGKVIDTHMHLRAYSEGVYRFLPEVANHYFAVQEANYIVYAINIGISGDTFFKLIEDLKPYKDRIGTMFAYDWRLIRTDPDFFVKAPDMLTAAVESGAIGLKCFKDLGLSVRDRDGSLLRIDDERLFPVWRRAGELGVIVAFHTTDPVAFFQPWEPENERWEELELHPEWSFADREKYPARETLLEQRDIVIKAFPNITFHGCHAGNNSEDIDALAARFEQMPNFVVDISARLGELGRHPASKGHDFFTKYQDRIMFGTDHMFMPAGDIQGAGPCRTFTADENRMFYETHWRYLQTWDTRFDHPTPIQGNWKIDGIGLDDNVLKKILWNNAYKLFHLERFGVA